MPQSTLLHFLPPSLFHPASLPSDFLCVYSCVWQESGHKQLARISVCVCACVSVHPHQVTGNTEQAGVDRYEPDWAASFNWKLQRMYYNSASHWQTAWHELKAGLWLAELWQTPAHINTTMWCVAWEGEEGRGWGRQRKGVVHQCELQVQLWRK